MENGVKALVNCRIKEMRLENGITLKKAAEYLGIKEATMQRYESGAIKTVKYSYIKKLSVLYGCSPMYLMGWSESKDKPYENTDMSGLQPYRGFPGLSDSGHIFENNGINAEFTFGVYDDSMSGAHIFVGDTVFVDPEAEPINGDICLISYRGTKYIRRYYKNDGKLIFQADNQAEIPLIFSQDELDIPVVIGKIVAVLNFLK